MDKSVLLLSFQVDTFAIYYLSHRLIKMASKMKELHQINDDGCDLLGNICHDGIAFQSRWDVIQSKLDLLKATHEQLKASHEQLNASHDRIKASLDRFAKHVKVKI